MTTKPSFSPQKIKKTLPFLIGSVFLFLIIMGAMGFVGGLETVWDSLTTLPAHVWVVLLLGSAINTLCRGARWPMGATRLKLNVPARRVWLFYICGFSLAATPGKIGTAIRLWLLKEKNGIRYQYSAPLFVLDQATDLLAILILTAWGSLALLGLFAGSQGAFLLQFALVGAATLFGILLLLYPPLLRRFIKLLYVMCGKRKPRLFGKVLLIFTRLNSLFSGSFLVFMIGFALIGWLAEMFALSYTAQALGQDISLQMACGILGFTILMSIFSFLPGGIGVAEASLAGLLTLAGVPLGIAVVLTALIRFFTLWIAVLMGLITLPFGLKSQKVT